jgi:hypothetical protein
MSAVAPPLAFRDIDITERLRTPFLIAAGILILLALLLEVGGLTIHPQFGPAEQAEVNNQSQSLGAPYNSAGLTEQAPGLGIPALALVDALLVFTMAIIIAGVILPQSVVGRVQGVATFIFTLLLLLAIIATIFVAIGKLILMISLILAFPFGPLVYLALFGFFNRTAASAVLSVLMFLKLAFAVCLVIAQLRFLENVGLVLLTLTSIVAVIIVSFLQGLVPRLLVSITDAVAAIIVGILALIWAIIILIGSIPAIIKALRPAR